MAGRELDVTIGVRRRRASSRARSALALAALAAFAHVGVSSAAGFSAPFVTAAPGQTITVPVNVSGATALEFIQFDVGYDRAIVRADPSGATAGALLSSDWFFTSPGVDDAVGGRVLGVSAFGSPIAGSGPVANLRFTALALGVSPVDFSGTFLDLSDQEVAIQAGRITVIVLPVPLSTLVVPLTAVLVAASAWSVYARRSRRSARPPRVATIAGSRQRAL